MCSCTDAEAKALANLERRLALADALEANALDDDMRAAENAAYERLQQLTGQVSEDAAEANEETQIGFSEEDPRAVEDASYERLLRLSKGEGLA